MLELFYPPVGLDVSLLVGTSDVPENVLIFDENGQKPSWKACIPGTPTLLFKDPPGARAADRRYCTGGEAHVVDLGMGRDVWRRALGCW